MLKPYPLLHLNLETAEFQFLEKFNGHYQISDETCNLIDLLLERIVLTGIAGVAKVAVF